MNTKAKPAKPGFLIMAPRGNRDFSVIFGAPLSHNWSHENCYDFTIIYLQLPLKKKNVHV